MLSPRPLHKRTGRWGLIIAIVIIAALVLVTAALAGPIGNVVLPNDEANLPSETLDQVAEANGIRIELTEANYAAEETTLHLVVSREAGPISSRTLLPIRAKQIETTNVGGDPSTFGSTTFYDTAPSVGTLGIDLAIGPVKDTSRKVTVTINELSVRQQSGQYKVVSGPWKLAFDPTEVADVGPVQTITVNKTATTDGVAIEVSKVELSETGIVVHYQIPELGSGQFMSVINDPLRVQFPDGTIHRGESTSASDPNGKRILRFSPLPEDASSFTLLFGSFMVTRDGSAQVSFDIPAAFSNVEPLTPVPVDKTFTFNGEQLRVSAISYENLQGTAYTPSNVDVTIVIEQTSGSISLAGPQSDATLVDDLGNVYMESGGFFSADASGFGFYGPIDPEATTLTLKVDSYGEIVPAPEPITIDVPQR